MENFIRQLVALVPSDTVTVRDLPGRMGKEQARPAKSEPLASEPEPVPEAGFGDMTWRQVEHKYCMYLLEKYKWNITRAAKAAGLNRSTFDSRIKKMGISKN